MLTRDLALLSADSWIGTRETQKDYVPGVTDWFGGPAWRGAWCCVWVSRWLIVDVGIQVGPPGTKGFSWVSSLFNWAALEPGWKVFTDPLQAQRGDLIGWEEGRTPGGLDHISVIHDLPPFRTIGANESDRVKYESFGGVPPTAVIFARPPYAQVGGPVQEDDDMRDAVVLEPGTKGAWHCHGLFRRAVPDVESAQMMIALGAVDLWQGATQQNEQLRRLVLANTTDVATLVGGAAPAPGRVGGTISLTGTLS